MQYIEDFIKGGLFGLGVFSLAIIVLISLIGPLVLAILHGLKWLWLYSLTSILIGGIVKLSSERF